MPGIDQFDFNVLMTRLHNAEDNITKLRKLSTTQHRAITSLVNLTVKHTRLIDDIYRDLAILQVETGVSFL